MRRLFTLSALLAVLAVALFIGSPPPLFATTCTTTCSVATLSCTPVSSCTSVPASSITCDGSTTACSTADAWCACRAQCPDCAFCSDPFECRMCNRERTQCLDECGTKPAFVSHC